MQSENPILGRVWELWTSGRRGEVRDAVESSGDEVAVLKNYLYLQGALYWEKKETDAVVAVSKWGMCFARSRGRNDALAVLLFNLSSFTLPWWSDSLKATPGQREEGFAAASALLDLYRSECRGPADFAKSQWVLGAHRYFRGEAVDAIELFNAALVAARAAEDRNLEAAALEGLGRTRFRMVQEDREWGLETLREAETLYRMCGDKINLKELENFLAKNSPPAPSPA